MSHNYELFVRFAFKPSCATPLIAMAIAKQSNGGILPNIRSGTSEPIMMAIDLIQRLKPLKFFEPLAYSDCWF